MCSRDGQGFLVPQSLLPELPHLDAVSGTLHVDATQAVLHVLVHYFFTYTYQCLGPKRESRSKRLAAEFSIAVRVRSIAREYQLTALEELARVEMEVLSEQLDFSAVLSLLQDVHAEPSANDKWLGEFVKLGLMLLVRKSSGSGSAVSNTEKRLLSLGDLVINCLKELVDEGHVVARRPGAPPTMGANGELTPGKAVHQTEPQESPADSHDTNLSEIKMPRSKSPEDEAEHTLGSETGSWNVSFEAVRTQDGITSQLSLEAERTMVEEDERAKTDAEAMEIVEEEQELARLEAMKARQGKLRLKKNRERYEFLALKAQQRADERIANDAKVVAVAEALPAPDEDPMPLEAPPDVPADAPADVPEAISIDRANFPLDAPEVDEISLEEEELALLELKKAKKGKLGKLRERRRYEQLKKRHDRRVEEKAAKIAEAEATAAAAAEVEAAPTEEHRSTQEIEVLEVAISVPEEAAVESPYGKTALKAVLGE